VISIQGSGTAIAVSYSEVIVLIIPQASGLKQARAPPSDVIVTIDPEGSGTSIKSGAGSAEAIIAPEGSGQKIVSGVGESTVIISTQGSGANANITAQGESEASVTISASGSGKKIAQDASETTIVISSSGSGFRAWQPLIRTLSVIERAIAQTVVERATTLTVLDKAIITMEVQGVAKIGTTVRLQSIFYALDGVTAVDLDAPPSVTIYDGARNAVGTAKTCTRSALGTYYYDYVVPDGTGPIYWETAGKLGGLDVVDRQELERAWV